MGALYKTGTSKGATKAVIAAYSLFAALERKFRPPSQNKYAYFV